MTRRELPPEFMPRLTSYGLEKARAEFFAICGR